MQRYFKYFKIPFIITAVIALVCIIVRVATGSPEQNAAATNTESLISNNVFNYSGALTDSQVFELEALIAAVENKTQCDIAVITLNESLEGRYSSPANKWVMEYADDFADQNKMGYDKAYGNSIVFVDNLYREPSTGKVYSWISTSCLAMSQLSQSECESIMDDALENLTDYSDSDDYFAAYKRVVSLIPRYMSIESGARIAAENMKPVYILASALFISLIYVLINWKSKLGSVTTTSTTYVQNGRPNITRKQDIFLRKSVTKRKIETSSGGGSGGHMSSGGHSHGGGGHSR